jgi:hypothetical protein
MGFRATPLEAVRTGAAAPSADPPRANAVLHCPSALAPFGCTARPADCGRSPSRPAWRAAPRRRQREMRNRVKFSLSSVTLAMLPSVFRAGLKRAKVPVWLSCRPAQPLVSTVTVSTRKARELLLSAQVPYSPPDLPPSLDGPICVEIFASAPKRPNRMPARLSSLPSQT